MCIRDRCGGMSKTFKGDGADKLINRRGLRLSPDNNFCQVSVRVGDVSEGPGLERFHAGFNVGPKQRSECWRCVYQGSSTGRQIDREFRAHRH